MIMSQTKREQVVSHIRYIREELREMHLGIIDDCLFPEPGEIRGVIAQKEALLELIEGNPKVNQLRGDLDLKQKIKWFLVSKTKHQLKVIENIES